MSQGFNNLIELEFNIQNAVQSDNSQFLSVIASLFLPISFLASLFGISTVTWPPIWYLYAAIPVFFASVIFTLVFPWTMHRVQDWLYPLEAHRVELERGNFTMLGSELPDSVDVPGGNRAGKVKGKAQRVMGMDGRDQERSRSRWRGEKGSDE